MGSYFATCEIVEANDRLDSVKYPGGAYQSHSLGLTANGKPPDLKPSSRGALDDDINKLFEAISLKNSSRGFIPLAQAGSGTNNLSKQAMKRPIAASMPQSPRISGTDPVSLKQALRDHCISKASEMAAMKRLSKPSASPGPSESGRKKNLYDPAAVGGKGNFEDVLFVPEESTSKKYGKNIPLQLRASGITNLSKSLDLGAHSSTRFKSPNQSTQSSPGYAVPATQYGAGTSSLRNEFVPPSRNFHGQPSKSPIQSALSSPRFATPKQQNTVGTSMQPSASSTSRKVGNQPSKSPTKTANSSPRKATPATQNGNSNTTRDDYIPTSRKVGIQAAKTDTPPKEMHCPAALQSRSDSADKKLKSDAVPTSKKVANKASVRRKSRLLAAPSFSVYAKGRLLTAPTFAIHGNRVGKLTRSNSRLKPALRSRSSGKKKTKLVPASDDGDSKGGNENFATRSSQLVCHKCQCALKNATEDSNQDSSSSFPVGHEVDVSTSNAISASCEPIFSESNTNVSRSASKVKKNLNSKDKGGVSQSSKSSLGDFSTSTSNSEESSASRPSCGNKPHMSQDIHWEAIRHVKRQDGALSLRHFNLLKKLGCGDIGTVYLAELIGSNCLFAIKVMDNEFLERRKKMPRAQTERDILITLDHPFLPTLYSQFTSDNLSCLVMEYCPGGDLHVLRQKQPGRCFPEPAARFYVAEVLLALEYLHMLGIIYRDLKPENILVREDGHIMLTDFDLSLRCDVSPTLLPSSAANADPANISGPCTESNCIRPFCIEPYCKVSCFSPKFLPAAAKARKLKADVAARIRSLPQLVAEPTDARSNSFVGTHEYLAPEIIKGEGHGAAVDWWTFGIFLYELLYGKTPFKGSGNEETLANVVLQSLRFPDCPLVSFHARDLIRGLLVKEPEHRLGTERGAAEIKQHPFFEGMNWALIRCAIPPETPDACDMGAPRIPMLEKSSKFLECKATGEHLEFELF